MTVMAPKGGKGRGRGGRGGGPSTPAARDLGATPETPAIKPKAKAKGKAKAHGSPPLPKDPEITPPCKAPLVESPKMSHVDLEREVHVEDWSVGYKPDVYGITITADTDVATLKACVASNIGKDVEHMVVHKYVGM